MGPGWQQRLQLCSVQSSGSPALSRLAATLQTSIQKGYVTDCSGECKGFAEYPQVYGIYPWGSGSALAFLAVQLFREENNDRGRMILMPYRRTSSIKQFGRNIRRTGRKNMGRVRYATRNIIFGFLGSGATTLLNFILRQVFITHLGDTLLGVQDLYSEILTMLSLAELGVGTALNYSLYGPVARGSGKKSNPTCSCIKSVPHHCHGDCCHRTCTGTCFYPGSSKMQII